MPKEGESWKDYYARKLEELELKENIKEARKKLKEFRDKHKK